MCSIAGGKTSIADAEGGCLALRFIERCQRIGQCAQALRLPLRLVLAVLSGSSVFNGLWCAHRRLLGYCNYQQYNRSRRVRRRQGSNQAHESARICVICGHINSQQTSCTPPGPTTTWLCSSIRKKSLNIRRLRRFPQIKNDCVSL
jgi:hypothetical protein